MVFRLEFKVISIDLRVGWGDDGHDMEPVSNIKPAIDSIRVGYH